MIELPAQSWILAAWVMLAQAAPARVEVEVEEEVARCAPANNGAGPLWCYGAPLVVRRGGEVLVSAAETGAGVPPLANMRPRLFRRSDAGKWELVFAPDGFREREPCPLAIPGDGSTCLSLNTSTMPPGTKYGACEPSLLSFARDEAWKSPQPSRPPWPPGASFTDHSYRGIAADARTGEILLLHIDSRSSEQRWCLRGKNGEWSRTGSIAFPIRACYPQVALRAGEGHVLAIGDVVEPVEAWRQFKREQTGNEWDYVFRRLFCAWSRDLAKDGFRAPVEVENLDATAGAIRNLDLWLDASGVAHVLYWKQTVQSTPLRDRFFPGTRIVTSLELAVLKDGAVVRRETLLAGGEGGGGIVAGNARFHSTDGSSLFVVGYVSGSDSGKPVSENRIFQIVPERGAPSTIPLREPLTTFFTSCERGGSEPSSTLDLFGSGGNGESLRYARVKVGRR